MKRFTLIIKHNFSIHNILAVLLFFLLFNVCKAQTETFYDYSFGLSNSLINKLTIDQFGRIWVATDNGINIFDGHRFRTIEFSGSRSITTLFLCSTNDMLIGTADGLYKYDFSTNQTTEMEIYVSDTR